MPKTYFTITDTGRVRSTNEDSLYARPPVFMVADGMGGAQAGEVASGEVARAFAGFSPPGHEPEKQLATLIIEVNGHIHEMAENDAGRSGMGTTVTAAVVAGDSVGIAHVGDSRAYRWRRGRLEQLTEDHSLVGEMLRQGRISEAEAEKHPQRSVITRALGIEAGVEVDTASFAWEPGDIFLLCSDGLSSMVQDKEISRILGEAEDIGAAGVSLVDAANTRGGRDNITVVLFSPEGLETSGGADGSSEADTGVISAAQLDTAHGAIDGSGGRSWFSSCRGRAVLIAIAGLLLLGGAWLANGFIYYVGSEGGFIAVYRGIPLEAGPLTFSSVHSVSDVRLEDLEPFEQERVQQHELKTRAGAERVVENYSSSAEDQRLLDEERSSRTTTTGTTAGGS